MSNNIIYKRFILIVAKTLLIILGMFLLGYLSFKISTFYYTKVNIGKESLFGEMFTIYKEEQSSKNVIYALNEKEKIVKIVVEVFDSKTLNVDYITIPNNSQFTLSTDMYQKLYSQNIDIPQIVVLKDLDKYIQKDDLFDSLNLLLGDLLGTNMSYYTILNIKDYENQFQTSKKSRKLLSTDNTNEGEVNTNETEIVDIEIYTTKFQETVKELLGNSEKIKKYIQEIYDIIDSDLKLKNKLKYVDDYAKIKEEQIYFHTVYGQIKDNRLEIDVDATRQLLNNIMENTTYTTKQYNGETGGISQESSKGLTILVYNGAGVSGLAKSFQDKLNLDGYTVTGIYNYEQGIIETTRIIVKNETMGYDLLSYFNEANIEVGDVPLGADIQIILGSEDGK